MQSLVAFDSSDGATGDELEDTGNSIEELVTQGDDPVNQFAVKHLSKYIVETLIPNRLHQKAADQARLDQKAKAVKMCHLDKRVKSDMHLWDKLNTVEDHKDDYEDNMQKHGICLEVLEGKDMVKNAYCASVKDYKDVCHCHEKMVKRFGQRGCTYVDNAIATPAEEIAPEHRECCDAFYEHEKKRSQCKNAKNDAAYAEKQHGIIMGRLCNTYDKCYDKNMQSYKWSEELAKKNEAHRSWPILTRIHCLVDEFKTGKVSHDAAKACKEKKVDPKKLIVYPKVPAKAECQEEVA